MSAIKSPTGVKGKIYPYEDFQGIDSSRDATALDTGQQQHFVSLVNGYCDWRGSVVRDPGANQRGGDNKVIQHVTFFGRDLAVWAQKDGGGITLKSERGHEVPEVYPIGSVVTSTVFNSRVAMASRNHPIYHYDGLVWKENSSPQKPMPAYLTAVQNRFAIAGMPGARTSIWFSRVDNEEVMPDDEEAGSVQVTKAAEINVRNIIGTADEIRGLGTFETNRLAVFTHDQTLIYRVHPDYTQWALDDKATIRVGTISHNTIAQAGVDLLFCSRDGVHSIRRSDANGVTIYSLPMSSKVDLLYRSLLSRVPDHEQVNAYYDATNGQYHIFFPHSDMLCTRLTMTLNPVQGGQNKWSTGTFLQARCGAQLGGVTILGTPGGLWNSYNIEDPAEVAPEMVITTPILWQGSLTDIKESLSFILQASGKGTIQVEAFDDTGRQLSSMFLEIDETLEDDHFPDIPLSRQFDRKFEHRYRGVQFRFTVRGEGLIKIVGFAVVVRGGK